MTKENTTSKAGVNAPNFDEAVKISEKAVKEASKIFDESSKTYNQNMEKFYNNFEAISTYVQKNVEESITESNNIAKNVMNFNKEIMEDSKSHITKIQDAGKKLSSVKTATEFTDLSNKIGKEMIDNAIHQQQIASANFVKLAKELSQPLTKQYESYLDLVTNIQK